jgi:hypothetical protein
MTYEYKNSEIFAKSVLNEINMIRMYPKRYLDRLRELENGNFKIFEDFKLKLYSKNFKSNLNGLIDEIKTIINLNPLSLITDMSKCAEKYLSLLQMRDNENIKEEINKIKTSPQYTEEFIERLRKYGNPNGVCGETIEIIPLSLTPELFVFKLLLDEESTNKLNRTLILHKKVKFVGMGSNFLPTSKMLCVIIDYCEDFFHFSKKLTINTKYQTNPNSQRTMTQFSPSREEVNLVIKSSPLSTQFSTSTNKINNNYQISNQIEQSRKNLLTHSNRNENIDKKYLLLEGEYSPIREDVDPNVIFKQNIQKKIDNILKMDDHLIEEVDIQRKGSFIKHVIIYKNGDIDEWVCRK